jgi:hypothetical protein
MIRGIENGPETLFGPKPISQTGYYNLQVANHGGDFDAAVSAIETPEDALNFSAGLADQAEADNNSDYIYSGGYAQALIGASLERQFGSDSSDKKNMWRTAFSYVIFGKETPGMWKRLISGENFQAGGSYEPVYFSKAKYREASAAFEKANEKLKQQSGL